MSGAFAPDQWPEIDRGNGTVVEELWAWVKVYGPGDEALASIALPDSGPLPPVFATRRIAEALRPLMETAQRQQGLPHVLRRYVPAAEQ